VFAGSPGEPVARFEIPIPVDTMNNRTWSMVIAVLCLAGCGRGQQAAAPQLPPPPTPMPPPVPLYYDNGGGIRDSTRVVIHDDSTFAEYWRLATSMQASAPPRPRLDFEREMAILVAGGQKKPDDEIRVDSLLVRPELNPDGKRVETLTIVVRSTDGCRQFITAAFPVQIVRARKFDGPVKWEERKDPACRDTPDR
jgi:hypothetical protein